MTTDPVVKWLDESRYLIPDFVIPELEKLIELAKAQARVCEAAKLIVDMNTWNANQSGVTEALRDYERIREEIK